MTGGRVRSLGRRLNDGWEGGGRWACVVKWARRCQRRWTRRRLSKTGSALSLEILDRKPDATSNDSSPMSFRTTAVDHGFPLGHQPQKEASHFQRILAQEREQRSLVYRMEFTSFFFFLLRKHVTVPRRGENEKQTPRRLQFRRTSLLDTLGSLMDYTEGFRACPSSPSSLPFILPVDFCVLCLGGGGTWGGNLGCSIDERAPFTGSSPIQGVTRLRLGHVMYPNTHIFQELGSSKKRSTLLAIVWTSGRISP